MSLVTVKESTDIGCLAKGHKFLIDLFVPLMFRTNISTVIGRLICVANVNY